MNRVLAVALGTCAVYGAAIFVGLHMRDLSGLTWPGTALSAVRWHAPARTTIPGGVKGESVRRGEMIFNETKLYAASHTGATISCGSCHAEGGLQQFASPMVGLPALFPMYNARAGHVISLKDRIQECFVRSENGKPLDYEGPEMKALVDYIDWLSTPAKNGAKYKGRGLVDLPDLTPDPVRGGTIFQAQCSGCHGRDGGGKAPVFPAVWGPNSFNDGAGMHGVKKMAAFVQHNMPQNRMGILTPQDAYDVSAFIHQQPRPAFNKEYAHY